LTEQRPGSHEKRPVARRRSEDDLGAKRSSSEDNAANGCSSRLLSDVEEANVLRIALDEGPALLDVLPHEEREDLISASRVLQGDPQHQALVGVHRGLPQLVGVHLTETLVTLD